MRKCEKCEAIYPNWVVIDGQKRNLQRRTFCLAYSPFGDHNTRDLRKPKGFKRCSRYKLTLPVTAFYYGCSRCKVCKDQEKLGKDIQLKWRAILYKGGKCERCGYKGHYAPFHFHHLRDKEMVWNQMRNCGWEKVRGKLINANYFALIAITSSILKFLHSFLYQSLALKDEPVA